MKIKIEEAKAGNRIEFFINKALYSNTILEIDFPNQRVKADYIAWNTQHKRNQWIPFGNIILCERSDMDLSIKEMIIGTINNPK